MAASVACAAACGFAVTSADSGRALEPGPGAADGGLGAVPAPSSDLPPLDNGLILVHAGKVQSFRLCFENELSLRPQPDSQAMPQANVVGVEVGSAVRVPPLRGAPGKVWLFEEALIRNLYFNLAPGNLGLSCETLLDRETGDLAIELQTDGIGDLSRGVHLLAVTGCPKNRPLTTYSVAECGASWTADKGNLALRDIPLPGFKRASLDALPTQLVNLSQPLESARAGKPVSVSFGNLTANAKMEPLVTAPTLLGTPLPSTPVLLPYDRTDEAGYDSMGFRVTLGNADAGLGSSDGGGADAGPALLDQSLARIQKLSSPRDVPSEYYTAASNFVLLLLGDPNARLPDGGADDDDRRNLHFLVVPVVEPGDAGSTTPAPSDAGGD